MAIGICLFIIDHVIGDDSIGLQISGYMAVVLGASWLICLMLIIPSAATDRDFVNKNFNTNYSIEEMFWNGDDIKSMLIGNKIRIDNGGKHE